MKINKNELFAKLKEPDKIKDLTNKLCYFNYIPKEDNGIRISVYENGIYLLLKGDCRDSINNIRYKQYVTHLFFENYDCPEGVILAMSELICSAVKADRYIIFEHGFDLSNLTYYINPYEIMFCAYVESEEKNGKLVKLDKLVSLNDIYNYIKASLSNKGE